MDCPRVETANGRCPSRPRPRPRDRLSAQTKSRCNPRLGRRKTTSVLHLLPIHRRRPTAYLLGPILLLVSRLRGRRLSRRVPIGQSPVFARVSPFVSPSTSFILLNRPLERFCHHFRARRFSLPRARLPSPSRPGFTKPNPGATAIAPPRSPVARLPSP